MQHSVASLIFVTLFGMLTTLFQDMQSCVALKIMFGNRPVLAQKFHYDDMSLPRSSG